MKIFYVLIICATIFNSCAWHENIPSESENIAQAQKLISQNLESYKFFIASNFSGLVSYEFEPNRFDFINKASKSASREHVLDLYGIVIKSDRKNDKLIVEFNWVKKRNKYNSASIEEVEGDSVFVYKKYKKLWLLIGLSGDNPFNI